MRIKLYIIILVFISFGSECSILFADDYLIARIYCSVRGYDAELRINDVLVKDITGNVGCALQVFDKKHPLSKKLSEKSRGLFCLTGGNNDIEISFKKIEGAKENYIKIEVLSDPELKPLFEYYTEDEFEGKITKYFYLIQ